MSNPSWMQRGYSAGDKAKEAEEQRRNSGKGKTRRHWMRDGSETYLTFVDDDPAVFREHQFKLNGHWRNWFTCIQGIPHPETGKPQQCPACARGNKSYFAAAYTVIDHSEWTDRDGNNHKDERRLLVVKDEVYGLLSKQSGKRKGLVGARFEVSRTGDKSPNTGNVWDFEEKVDLGQYGDEATPVDYATEFAPLTAEVLAQVIGGQAPSQSSGGNNSGGGTGGSGGGTGGSGELDEDIPF